MSKLKVLITDDHRIVRQALAESVSIFEEVGEVQQAANGREALETVKSFHPDVILMDIQMPEMDGVDATSEILERYPDTKIIALTSVENPKLAIKMIELGANAYCLKDIELTELRKAINSVVENDFYHNDLIVSVMRQEIKTTADKNELLYSYQVNERERKILKLICKEKTTTEIADAVFLSPRTVEKIRKELAQKLNVKGVVGLVRFAINNGYDI